MPVPWCFFSHAVAYLIGEMWMGVVLAVVVELVPADLAASATAVYVFVINMIGGNMNILVPPVQDSGLSLQLTLLILFPGCYLLGAFLFTITFFLIKEKTEDKMDQTATH